MYQLSYKNSFLYRNLSTFVDIYFKCDCDFRQLGFKVDNFLKHCSTDYVVTRTHSTYILTDDVHRCYIAFNISGVFFNKF